MSRRRNAPLHGVAAIGSNMTQAEHGDLTILYSYRTPVAFLSPKGGYVTDKFWSNTTSKHISKFFQLHGYDRKGAFKLPQEDLELFASAGRVGPQSSIRENPPLPGERHHDLARAEDLLSEGPTPIVFDNRDLGTWIDGAYGTAHALEKMASMVARVMTPEASELLEEFEEGIDEEYESEWLDDATEELNAATEEGLSWVWDGGDLILTDEEE